jgi:secreted Zn-dependent insulinase-like peptidase
LLKRFVLEGYSSLQGYDNKNAMHKSLYLMNVLIDKMKIKVINEEDESNLIHRLKAVNLKNVNEVKNSIFQNVKLDIIYIGNLNKQEALNSSESIHQEIKNFT